MQGRFNGRIVGQDYTGRNARHNGRAGVYNAIQSANIYPWQLPFVDRYWDARYSLTASAERVTNWVDMKQGTDLPQASGAAQPIELPYSGTNYLWCSGVVSNYASAPDSVPLSITGDIDVRVRAVLDDWTPAAINALIQKAGSAPTRSWALYVNTNGTLQFVTSTDGTAASSAISSAATGITNGAEKWIRVTRAASSGDVVFYLSDDGASWSQLGTTQSTTAGALYDNAEAVQIGQYLGGLNLAGRIYRAQIYNGIAGTLVFDANFMAVAEGATSFTESSSNAATVTINTSGAKPAQIVGRPWVMGDAAAYFLQTAALTIPAPYAIAVCVRFNSWAANDVLFDGVTANSFAAQQVTGTPQIRMHDASANSSTVSPTLGTKYILFASQAADGTLRYRLNLGTAVTGTLSATALAGLTLLSDGAGANQIGAQVCAEAQCGIAPSVAQEEQLIRAMASQYGVSL